ncbi:MAG: carboxymuconolactone decarboxylase family protein [Nitrososphaerales archaeon]|nr:carboxymuconolactone decarboxylase family protein [Nitrososphaerales archaeon]
MYKKLGEACSRAGPIEDKYIELIKLAIWGTRIQYTPFKTHVRLALRNGATPEEIRHAIIQLLTAEGISTTTIAMNWANEVIADEIKKRKR